MCTAINMNGLFGRTLDVERSFGERVCVTRREEAIELRHEGVMREHLAILGMAAVIDGVPLYFDAVNEAGLCMAALKYPDAVYHAPRGDRHNVASFELIKWVLGRCKSLGEARELLGKTSVTDDCFSESIPPSPLHFIVADGREAIVIESEADGLKIYSDPFGVLTNAPSFYYHELRVRDFMHLTSRYPENTLCPELLLVPYSGGMGAYGLPGDFSSASRFVRAVFVKNHAVCEGTQSERVNAFLRVMDTVSVPKGCEKNSAGESVYTRYASCIDLATRTYFYTTCDDRRIRPASLEDALSLIRP